MKIFYLAQDLDDPAILRRATQLSRGGAQLHLAGFRRRSLSPPPQGVVHQLGRTADGRLARRILTIFVTALRVFGWGRNARGIDVIVARSLEMLFLGAVVRLVWCREVPLVYECLDIHRLMVKSGPVGRTLRRLEGGLLRSCSLLITSSPGFVENYFRPVHSELPDIFLWENRMLASELALDAPPIQRSSAKPWRIGWFGIIRCERSLALLEELCRALPGQIEVDIRGRPTDEMVPKLTSAAAATNGLRFGGSYDRARDLADIYGRVHFTWAIDFFEEGANSNWLLPNRLYEGPAHGAIPIALKDVETGRWLDQKGVGVLLGPSVAAELLGFFHSLDAAIYMALADKLFALDPAAFRQLDADLIEIVRMLSRLAPTGRQQGRERRNEQPA